MPLPDDTETNNPDSTLGTMDNPTFPPPATQPAEPAATTVFEKDSADHPAAEAQANLNREVPIPPEEPGEIGPEGDYKIAAFNTNKFPLNINGTVREFEVGKGYTLSEGDVQVLLAAGVKLERIR